MKHKLHPTISVLIISILVFFAVVTRFINLDWGAPYFFHPDERNIAFAVTQLEYPTNLNPHFFAYGSLPIYLIYFTSVAYTPLHNIFFSTDYSTGWITSFEMAILVSRFYSAFLSLLLLPVLYKTVRLLSPQTPPLLPILFSIFSIGLIQYSHFGTFEMWLTFFSTLLFLAFILFLQSYSTRYFYLQSALMGVLLSIKISSLSLGVLLICGLLFYIFYLYKNHSKFFFVVKRLLILGVPGLVISLTILFSTSPFILLDFTSFRSSINYESSVALGTLPVFYTGGFLNTIPIFYQLTKVYPFILNPILGVLLPPALLFFIISAVRKKDIPILVLLLYVAVLFFSQAFLFVKWTRYYIPTLPFLYVIFSISLIEFYKHLNPKLKKIGLVFFSGIIAICVLYSFIFIKTVYLSPDTRIEAALWASNNIGQKVSVISEVYDLGIVPFNMYLPHIELINFYEFENNSALREELYNKLPTTDYIILPSIRIINSRLSNPKQFPYASNFYDDLFTNKQKFEFVYQTPCNMICKLIYLSPTGSYFEETTSVFDRPTIFIFKVLK